MELGRSTGARFVQNQMVHRFSHAMVTWRLWLQVKEKSPPVYETSREISVFKEYFTCVQEVHDKSCCDKSETTAKIDSSLSPPIHFWSTTNANQRFVLYDHREKNKPDSADRNRSIIQTKDVPRASKLFPFLFSKFRNILHDCHTHTCMYALHFLGKLT